MPRPRGKDKPHEPQAFAIRFHRGRWQVKQGTNWMTAREVSLLAPAICTPSGEICGMGVVTKHDNVYAVTP